jgi:hypothetical protein
MGCPSYKHGRGALIRRTEGPFDGLGTVPPHLRGTAEVFACATAEPREIVACGLAFGHRWTLDLIACDMVTACGVDVAEALGVPLVFDNADIRSLGGFTSSGRCGAANA